jgi:hypothetical protein
MPNACMFVLVKKNNAVRVKTKEMRALCIALSHPTDVHSHAELQHVVALTKSLSYLLALQVQTHEPARHVHTMHYASIA